MPLLRSGKVLVLKYFQLSGSGNVLDFRPYFHDFSYIITILPFKFIKQVTFYLLSLLYWLYCFGFQNSITRDRKITLRCSTSSLDTKNSLSFLTYKKGNIFSYWRQKSNTLKLQSILIISYSMYVLNSVSTQYFKCR